MKTVQRNLAQQIGEQPHAPARAVRMIDQGAVQDYDVLFRAQVSKILERAQLYLRPVLPGVE